jgi:hypothetical protein
MTWDDYSSAKPFRLTLCVDLSLFHPLQESNALHLLIL